MIIPLAAVVLAGCDDPVFTEWRYGGNQIAVEICIKRNTSTLIDTDIIKRACIKKHQHRIALTQIFGTLGKGTVVANIIQILTALGITIQAKTEGNDNIVAPGYVENIWIDPHGSKQVYVDFKTKESGEAWGKVRGLIESGADWSCGIFEMLPPSERRHNSRLTNEKGSSDRPLLTAACSTGCRPPEFTMSMSQSLP